MSLKNRLKTFQNLLESYPGSRTKDNLDVELVKEMEDLRRSLLDNDWTKVLTISKASVGLSMYLISNFRMQAPDRVLTQKHILFQFHYHAFRAAAKSPNREEFFSTLEEKIEQSNPDVLNRLKPSFLKLKEGRLSNVPLLDSLKNQDAIVLSPREINIVLSTLSRGMLGLIHYEFNKSFSYWTENSKLLERKDLLTTLAYIINNYRNKLNSYQANIQGFLMKDCSNPEIELELHRIRDYIFTKLPRFVRVLAASWLAAKLAIEQGKGDLANKIGSLNEMAGTLTRESIASLITSTKLSVDLEYARHSHEFEKIDIIKKAIKIPFQSNIPDGKNTSLSSLPNVADGDFIEVKSFITKIHTKRNESDELICIIELFDPSSNTKAKAVSKFVNFHHIGLRQFSYCRINAEYKSNIPALDGEHGLLIDRFSQEKLSDESWRYAFIISAKKWYSAYPNGHNIFWSLGPHIPASDISLAECDTAGAAELYFLKF